MRINLCRVIAETLKGAGVPFVAAGSRQNLVSVLFAVCVPGIILTSPVPAVAQGTNICTPTPFSDPPAAPNTLIDSADLANSNPDTELAFVEQAVGDEVVTVPCTFAPSGQQTSGTWSSQSNVTHILVKAGQLAQVFEVTTGTSGVWSTQCIVNDNNQPLALSHGRCYRADENGNGNGNNTGTIIIKKKAIKGDGATDFEFTGDLGTFVLTPPANGMVSQTFSNVAAPSDISVSETPVAGWTTNLSCTDPSNDTAVAGLTAAIKLSAGETVTCTFTNRKVKEDEPSEEETKRFINRRVDNLLTHGPDRARLLRRLQEQAPDLKGGPLKLSGGDATASSARTGTDGFAHSARLQSGAFGHRDVAETGVPWVDAIMGRAEEEPFGMAPADSAGPTSTSSALLSSIAGQLMPLMNGETSFKFGTSLGEIRASAAEAEARAQQKKLQEAGLSFGGQPYTNPFLGVRQGLDFWVEGHITRYHDDIGGINREGDFRILYVGADYVLDDGILVGALVQVDDTNEDIDDPTRTGEIDGTGWMVGPYFGARVLDNLFFDARAAWGQSDNDIWIDDAAGPKTTGSFDTERWLATATLTGVHYHGAWRFSPQVGLAYGHESYDTYVNSIGQTVAGGEANIGRLTGGTEVAYRLQTWDGTIVEPMLGITGIWNFDSDDLVINGVVQETDDNRAKLEGGVMIRTPSGWALRAAGMYDGIGGDDFEAYGGSLWVNVPMDEVR